MPPGEFTPPDELPVGYCLMCIPDNDELRGALVNLSILPNKLHWTYGFLVIAPSSNDGIVRHCGQDV